jgi:hypothetical protein
MTRHPENDVEPRVRAAWRAISSERTPAALDAAVIADARRSLAARTRQRAAWVRPLALAASVGICLAIVLELAHSPDGGSAGADARAVHEAAVESRAQKQGDVPRAKAGGTAASIDTPAGHVPDAPADAVTAPAVLPDGPGSARPCRQAEELPDEWLACIADLDAAGDADTADLERRRFDEAFAAPGAVSD